MVFFIVNDDSRPRQSVRHAERQPKAVRTMLKNADMWEDNDDVSADENGGPL